MAPHRKLPHGLTLDDVTIHGSTLTIRPEILNFAMLMEAKMRKHDADRGTSWKTMTPVEALRFVNAEGLEMHAAVGRYMKHAPTSPGAGDGPRVELLHECADVANGLMFLVNAVQCDE